jgi:hypothetical protein
MRTSLFIFGTLALGVFVGCGGQTGADTDGLDSESAALVAGNAEVDETEESVEVGVEEAISGAAPEEAATAEDAAEKARLNPGIFFKPAGCIVSTRAANVVTHVFTDCTGPYGMRSFNGTITSTWTKIATGVQVVHSTKGFKINGATVDHTVTIQYTKLDGVLTRTRKGLLSGTTAKGSAISHTADYVTTFDIGTKCVTRNGSSTSSIGTREWSRSIAGYKRCGVGTGLGLCPASGTIKLDGPKHDVGLSFPGGAFVDITVDGKKFRRALYCTAPAA